MTEKAPQVNKRYYTRLMDIYRHNDFYVPGFNFIARSLLQAKAESEFKSISKKAIEKEKEIQAWFETQELFFGHGVFRSGTTFLADFLNRNVAKAVVQHEANVNDYWFYAKAMQDHENAISYILDYRKAELYFRVSSLEKPIYGEINPFLRRHCDIIASEIPKAKQFHLVRDPREVLRSLMSRELFSKKDPMAKLIFPPKGDPHLEKWPEMTRFEKLCWMWASDNRFIREHVSHCVTFEEMLRDRDYFEQHILNFLNLEMDLERWNAEVGKVNNSTPRYTFPKYADWSAEQKRQFEAICGSEMAFYGY